MRGYGDFDVVASLTQRLEIREGITSIDDDLFYDWSEITYLSIPASMTYIGSGAFSGTFKLENVVFAEGFAGDFYIHEAQEYDEEGDFSTVFYESHWLEEAVDNGYFGATWVNFRFGSFVDMTIGGKSWRFKYYWE